MQTIFNLPESTGDDLKRFQEDTDRFRTGKISAAEYRALRVPMGIYEQREEGTFMLRVRVPAGSVLPQQMRTLAAVARKYGNGVLHVTTRQDIQVHRVRLDRIQAALLELNGAGLSTKGGGGNTVRNITSCPDAGVCAQEAFDVSPHCVALTEFLVADPLSFQLPRKYKIAFSGCPKDCSGARVNDLGFVAKRSGGALGFAVYVGGGMGKNCRVGDLLEEFIPQGEAHLVAEAVKRVFDQHGNRKDRNKARLRFLIEQVGLARFRELYAQELERLRKASPASGLPVRDLPRRERSASGTAAPPHADFSAWRRKNVLPQKQSGYHLVHIPLPLGDIPSATLEKLAEAVEEHGEGMARTTQSQNLVVRWVHEDELASFHRLLASAGLAKPTAPVVRNLISCTGASTCKLGICLSRGLAGAVAEKLVHDRLDRDELGEFSIHISGCPNSCGRHPIAHLGFFGVARRIGGRLVPHYVVQVGGGTVGDRTRLAEGREAVPARSVPAFVADFLRAFMASPECPDYEAFLAARGREAARKLVAAHQRVPPFEEDKNYYYDWGAEGPFSLAGRGEGQCSAGVFDLIEVDLKSSRDALRDGNLFAATVLAARALLVTQGQEARTDADALRLFSAYFLDAGHVNATFRPLIEHAQRSALASRPEEFHGSASAPLLANIAEVSALIQTVQTLYDRMDPSLRFPSSAQAGAQPPQGSPASPSEPSIKIDREADFHGVACPLNYVKTKLLLEQMEKGQVLSVLLNQEGVRNVPASVERDGHTVLSVKQARHTQGGQAGDRWLLIVRKS
jgi:sulfite reductase (ferredoxin)